MALLTPKQANNYLKQHGRTMLTVQQLKSQKRLYPIVDHWYRHRYSVQQLDKYIEETKER